MGTYLSRDQILSASDTRYEDVAVPEWGGTVRVRGLSAAERDEIEQSAVKQRGNALHYDNKRQFRAQVLVLCIVDDEGHRIFGRKDIEALGEKSAAATDRVYAVAQRLSGISDEDEEEVLGNDESDFGEARAGGSRSASP